MGGGDVHHGDGSVTHETVVCAGTYSPGTCTGWRAGAGRDLVARCRYTVTNGRRVYPKVGYFRCDSPTDDLRGCYGAFNWTDLGPTPPNPRPAPSPPSPPSTPG
ncbi:hypothetical protein, partial [Phenylobacterium sp.]|uniref:hypothetical protein n=1 Tax=Phenylobacterium sp. TaxID=1871053 RepID=UPI002F3EE856